MKPIDKKKFAAIALDLDHDIFVIYITTLNNSFYIANKIYPRKKTLIAQLKIDKAFIKYLSKYANFADVFLAKFVLELIKHIYINNHAIKFMNYQQLP